MFTVMAGLYKTGQPIHWKMVHGDLAKPNKRLGEIDLTGINVNERPIEFADKLIPIIRMEYVNLGACHGWYSTYNEWNGLTIIRVDFDLEFTTIKADK